MFAAAWYFPKLSAFWQPAAPVSCTICQGGSSRQSYYFLTFWLLCSFYKDASYPKSRGTTDTVYSHSFYRKLQRDKHGMGGKREDRRVQAGFLHAGEGRLFQTCFMSVCRLLISSQTNTQHRQRPCWAPHAKRWSWNPAAAEEISLGNIRWAEKGRSPYVAVCCCLKKPHYQPWKKW